MADRERGGSRLRRLAQRTVGLKGWRRYGVAALLGIAAALALPPIHGLPLLVPAFVGLVWLIDGSRSKWAAFAAGWWFGFGHFVAGTYWISEALLVEPEKFAWLVPFAVFGLSAGFAVFPALATLAAAALWGRGVARVLALAVAWTAAEWLRGHVLTGFPWNLIATAWTVSDAALQPAAVTGAYGLSLLTVILAAMPAVPGDPRPAPSAGGWRAWRPVVVATVAGLVVWAGGAIRLSQADGGVVDGVRLRIVQANIDQRLKWRPDMRETNLRRHMELSLRPGFETVTTVIWPEAAVPTFLALDGPVRQYMSRAVPKGGVLITGAPRTEPGAPGARRAWNSLYAIDDSGRVIATYDKHHLVPFGEYIPLRAYFDFDKIAHGRGDFSPGPGPRTLVVDGLPPFSPLICYEAIFPGAVVDRSDRPQWLLNVTNDAWFGSSSGPYQHLASARLRAVEEGLPLVRVANTGISAVVDAHGRVIAKLALNHAGIIDVALPMALSTRTLYARFGDWLALMMAVIALAPAAVARLGRRSPQCSAAAREMKD